jgi:hypothetical protein
MSGVLDNKSRILDSIVTLEGRRQLANGGINIRYVTFNDATTFYAADLVSGSADATARLYLESCHLPQDQITFRSDESGKVLPFDSITTLGLGMKSGQLLSSSFIAPDPSIVITGSMNPMLVSTTITGSFLTSYVSGVLGTSIDNFKKLRTTSTKDPIFEDDGFGMGSRDIEFVINDKRPIANKQNFVANVNHLEDIYSDPRLSGLSNFKFLPPINRVDDKSVDKTSLEQTSRFSLGKYQPWGPTDGFDQFDVINSHSHYANLGYVRTLNFDPTSRANNLFIQAFEVTNDTMFKLDLIDFGTWYTPVVGKESYQVSTPNQIGPTVSIVFVGRLLLKPETNTHTFIHLFTLLFG